MLGPRLPFRALLLALTLAVLGLVPALARQGTPVADPATPTAGVETQLLLELPLPAGSLPSGEVEVGFGRGTYAPGAVVAYPAGAFQRGVAFDHVLAGSYAVRVDGAAAVVRAGSGGAPGTPEAVPLGTPLTLAPGETMVYLDNEAAQTLGSAGQESVAILIANVSSTVPAANPPGPPPVGIGLEGLGALTPAEWALLPPGAVTLRLSRVTLAPGASRGVGAAGELGLLAVEAGLVGLGAREGMITDVRAGTEGRIAPGAEAVLAARDFAVLRPGTVGAARNAGDGPVSFWTLTFVSAGVGEATPVAGTPGP